MPSDRFRKLRRVLPWMLLPPFALALVALELRLKRSGPARGLAGPGVVWVYSPREPGAIISTPFVDDQRVYVSVIRDRGLAPGGAVIAIELEHGRPVWTFDDGGAMIHMFSSPRLADGRLYVGEGMHANFDCKLTCLEAETGQKAWRFPADGHIESTPCIADGRVYFGAGDDGLYAIDAVRGEKIWQFREGLHIDSSPAVAEGKVFAGSGVSRRLRATEIVALDAVTGKDVWRVPVDLPAWGSPVVDGDQLFIGLGNGRLDRSDPNPAGAVLCLDAATGKRRWTCPLPDDVGLRVAVDERHVYFGCRDGHVYAAARADGRIAWKYQTGSPMVTAPALLDGRLYATGSAGRVVCLDTSAGSLLAVFDVAEHAGVSCRLWSSPTVRRDANGRHRVFFGTELRYPDGSMAALYCLRF